jgi:glucose/arabinose dehydrogenase
MVRRPQGAWPQVPAGFEVTEFATGLNNPRQIVTAPNGDLFIAESGPGQIRILRGVKDGHPEVNEVYATGLSQPFGLAFYPNGANPKYLYVGNTDAVVRIPYHNGDLKASAAPEHICDLPGGGRLRGGGHWTRDVKFSPDNKTMLVSVGSISNVHERPNMPDERRADILAFTPEGKNERIYAAGIRNAVSIAFHPSTKDLWCSVNERDGLGDDLVPDYISRVKEGGFYGWPWYYIGAHQDPRHPGAHPELKDKVLVPDVLLTSHVASLGMTFYTGKQFPSAYHEDIFAAEHGSWNRARRVGYEVVRVPLKKGVPSGEYEDFMTGFVTPEGDVWGRPVGVTVAQDGALIVTDDGSNTVWRVTHKG